MAKSNVTKETTGELVQGAPLPSYIRQSGHSRGNENISKDDIQIPRIAIVQGLSPQVNKQKPEYIEGAEIGSLFNTVTNELYPSEICFTPVTFSKSYLVWVNRKKDKNGGLRGVFTTEEQAEKFLEEQEDSAKLEVVPTAEHLVLLDDGTEIILSMAKSKMKVSRKFNSLVRLNGNDRFSRRYKLSSVDDKSPEGEFKNFKISESGFPSEQVYMKAERLYSEIEQGDRVVSTSYTDSSASEEY